VKSNKPEDKFKEGVKGTYSKDKNMLEKFENDEYKLSFIHLLLPYANKYYQKGLIIPKKIRENFEDIADENDEIQNILKQSF
jgi:hypothetical protein